MSVKPFLAIILVLTACVGYFAWNSWQDRPEEVVVQAPMPLPEPVTALPVENELSPAASPPQEPAFHISLGPETIRTMTQQEIRDLIAIAMFGKVFNVSGQVLETMATKLIPKLVEKPDKPKEAKPTK